MTTRSARVAVPSKQYPTDRSRRSRGVCDPMRSTPATRQPPLMTSPSAHDRSVDRVHDGIDPEHFLAVMCRVDVRPEVPAHDEVMAGGRPCAWKPRGVESGLGRKAQVCLQAGPSPLPHSADDDECWSIGNGADRERRQLPLHTIPGTLVSAPPEHVASFVTNNERGPLAGGLSEASASIDGGGRDLNPRPSGREPDDLRPGGLVGRAYVHVGAGQCACQRYLVRRGSL